MRTTSLHHTGIKINTRIIGRRTLSHEQTFCQTGIKNTTHAILRQLSPPRMRFHLFTGIKINTHTMGGHTKLRTTSLCHTGIKINTRTIGGRTLSHEHTFCHTGIKINTRITWGIHPFVVAFFAVTRVLKLIPMLFGEHTKLRTTSLNHTGIKNNTRATGGTSRYYCWIFGLGKLQKNTK